jgi:AcrR family transcriptional regulator
MVSEGYASVTTRRVASTVGLTPALVHYYFPTTEDLLVAAYRRAAERYDRHLGEAFTAPHPFHVLWNLLTDPNQMALGVEFMALANHRKIIRTEIALHDERARRMRAGAMAIIFAEAGIAPKTCPPLCALMLMEGMSRAFIMEEMLGISCAHPETRAFIKKLLDDIERPIKARNRPERTLRKTKTMDAERLARPSARTRSD